MEEAKVFQSSIINDEAIAFVGLKNLAQDVLCISAYKPSIIYPPYVKVGIDDFKEDSQVKTDMHVPILMTFKVAKDELHLIGILKSQKTNEIKEKMKQTIGKLNCYPVYFMDFPTTSGNSLRHPVVQISPEFEGWALFAMISHTEKPQSVLIDNTKVTKLMEGLGDLKSFLYEKLAGLEVPHEEDMLYQIEKNWFEQQALPKVANSSE